MAAAAVAAPPSFSTSTSSFRASQSQLAPTAPFSYSDSPLTQLPAVDLNFEDLRQRMAAFTAKFDAFIERGRKRVLEERNEFRARLGEIGEEQKSTKTQIVTLQASLGTQAQVLAREQTEKREMHAQIAQLESHQSTQAAARDRLRTAIAHTRRQIEGKLQAQREWGERADAQGRLNGPELNFWETYLGCRIDGSGEENKVRITYVFPPPKAGRGNSGGGGTEEREAVFDLQIPDSSSGEFAVTYVKPKLDQGKVSEVVGRLNETKDIATLLKGMRTLFVEEMK